jgi:serine/threonine-protein kinase
VEHESRLPVGAIGDGRYRIEKLLGEGSVGAVYRAVDAETGQVVALKQWHAGMLNEEIRGRFQREARALATLDHPNIVKVIGHGFVGGVPYVVLEYLEGQTVESLLRGGKPIAPDLAFELMRQTLAAIAYAHKRSVVHRDLKPENIFVARDASKAPHVKILDYGLAKFMGIEASEGQQPLTATGMMIGTPLYMPPEQGAGSSIDVAVDVYAMGCVFFEMLSGRPPFLAESNVELFNAHLKAPVPKLEEALDNMRVAPELQALIDRAMAKKQTERFPNAGAMLDALNKLPDKPVTPISRLRASLRPGPASSIGLDDGSPMLSWGLGLAVLALGGLAFVVLRAC